MPTTDRTTTTERITLPPMSVLDLSIVPEGHGSPRALRDTRALALAADELGFARFWVAEHHNSASVASTSPAVLLGALSTLTKRIRLGSGGVMLPNHAPLAVAEQFAMLEALAPGRIDLGVGRAPGTDPITAAALRRGERNATGRFPQDLALVLDLLGDARQARDPEWRGLRATPAAEGSPETWMLGSSLHGARLAGELGLPFAFAGHFSAGASRDALAAAEQYRANFTPSARWPRPHFMLCVSAITAPDRQEAELRSEPARAWRHQITTGSPAALMDPDGARAYGERVVDRELYARLRGHQLADVPLRVAEGLAELATATGAQELMLAITTHDVAHRISTLRDLAPYLPR